MIAAALLAQQFAPRRWHRADGSGRVGYSQDRLGWRRARAWEKFQHLQRHLEGSQQHAPNNGQVMPMSAVRKASITPGWRRAGRVTLRSCRQGRQHGPPPGAAIPGLRTGGGCQVGRASRAGGRARPPRPASRRDRPGNWSTRSARQLASYEQALGWSSRKSRRWGKAPKFLPGRWAAGASATRPWAAHPAARLEHALRPKICRQLRHKKRAGSSTACGRANALVLGRCILNHSVVPLLAPKRLLAQRAQGRAPVQSIRPGPGFRRSCLRAGRFRRGRGAAGHGVGLMHRAHPRRLSQFLDLGAAAAPARRMLPGQGDSIAPGRAGWRCPSTGGRALAARGWSGPIGVGRSRKYSASPACTRLQARQYQPVRPVVCTCRAVMGVAKAVLSFQQGWQVWASSSGQLPARGTPQHRLVWSCRWWKSFAKRPRLAQHWQLVAPVRLARWRNVSAGSGGWRPVRSAVRCKCSPLSSSSPLGGVRGPVTGCLSMPLMPPGRAIQSGI